MARRIQLNIALLSLLLQGLVSFQFQPSFRHVSLARRASSIDAPPTHPKIKEMVVEAAAQDFVPATVFDRSATIAGIGAVMACVAASDTIPTPIRITLASLIVFANFEYCFHRWVMHSPQDGAVGKGAFGPYQKLHQTHHTETLDDMQLDDGEESDPRHIYFSATTTVASVLISTAVLVALDSVFHLGFTDVPQATAAASAAPPAAAALQGFLGGVQGVLPCAEASVAVALLHTSLWQTLHGDIHEYYEEYDAGFPRVDALSQDTPYTRWMVSNHVGHHVVNGKGNYNIVFPGPDYLWGTCFVPSNPRSKE
mmetsp:Transcript_45800/g.92429  ORF Transcript_45800/g.92429 Transcript_45800/m.92429 type:complete len:311 (-) Transcript_45800:133-1065(-)|eukprot:CAMPEP_0171695860 /NCGR_PEP_ID=MMETSP0991-20121206/7988_1 /TAXON_ID=483369 /ORGANISM="non described non described, Strain CCMP2098" /LENGTH=310 /DNA_ID=CAMNT_0012284565 /DNA_START=22 /DNA_END=954 /DNA_ORIENTATION=+